jgi:hypothetical protein
MTHDPLWPFPQYDAQGRRLEPAPPPAPRPNRYPADMPEALL